MDPMKRTVSKMASKIAIIAIVFACACVSSAQVISSGACPNVTIQQDFDVASYLGRWYEYKHYVAFFQQNGECTSATYGTNDDGTVSVRNYLVNSNTGEEEIIIGYAELASDSGEGKLLVNFPSVGAYNSDYWVLGTDYQSYTVVWSCNQVGSSNLQYSWLLTRERYPDALTLGLAQQVIDENGLQDAYTITKHENCPLDP